MPELGTFEGRDVLQSKIIVRKAGDGLSSAVSVDPRALHQGDRVYVVLECEVGPIKFDLIKDTDALARVHDLIAQGATFADAEDVKGLVDAQKDRILRAKEQEQGVERLDFAGGDDAEADATGE